MIGVYHLFFLSGWGGGRSIHLAEHNAPPLLFSFLLEQCAAHQDVLFFPFVNRETLSSLVSDIA